MQKSLRLFFLLLLSIAWSHSAHSQAANKNLPNIIYIMADDLGYGDIGPYGQTMIKTPNLDAFAKQGMRFTQCYAGSTVCAPSRSALMTGQHTGHTRIRGNALAPLGPGDTTFAQLLKQAGYATGMIGKWALGDTGSTGIPANKGFDYFYGYLNQTAAHNYYPEFLWENDRLDSLHNVVSYSPEGNAKGVSGIATEKHNYSPDKFLEKTLRFLEQNKSNAFFLYLPYTLPHANNEARYFKQSGMEVPRLGQYQNMSWPYDQRAHAAMITYLDTQVGIILNKLKELKLENNTLVIFTSDNGPHNEGGANSEFFNSNGPLRGAKRDMYEGGIRVPFMARWPGKIKAGSVSNNIVAFWDILPTFCAIAGARPTRNIDGISFLPTLTGKPQVKHEYLYWEFYEQGGKQAVRFGNWKCIRLNVNKPAETETLLFDLSSDLGEQHNIATQHAGIVAKAMKLMKEAHVYSNDFHFDNEQMQ